MAPRRKREPIAFIGKGVVFDSGGISIKPAGSMEDMKGDMAGAAAVTRSHGTRPGSGGRRRRANVVGIIGLVRRTCSTATAQRPGDIVTSMSGQTIEVIKTDAEGPARSGRCALVLHTTASSRNL